MAFFGLFGGGDKNTLTDDELAAIVDCEEYFKSPGAGIDHPGSQENQERFSSLVDRGVTMEENEHGDWVWHKNVEKLEEEKHWWQR